MTVPSLPLLRQACLDPLPHPDADEIDAAIRLVGDYIRTDYFQLPDAPVGRTAGRAEMEDLLREPPPEQGMAFAEALQQLQKHVAPFALRPQHPRFLAFVPGAPTFVSILGDWLCAGLNLFGGVWKEAPGAAQVEILVLDWFKQFLGYPQQALGVLTGGGSEANLLALVTARASRPRSQWQRLRVYVSGQRHYSIDRACMVMGLDAEQLRIVDVDESGRLRTSELERMVRDDRAARFVPALVVANAGATNTGAVDPLAEIAKVCQAHSLWFHVDAAYGWPAVLTERGRGLLPGIERADSLTLDPHKWFAQPFEAGCLLVRDGKRLPETFHLRPEYMQDVAPGEAEINFSDHGIALTRRFRALKIWLSVKVLGLSWFRRLVEHCCALADYAAALLQVRGQFEINAPPSLSILCFRHRAAGISQDRVNDFNLELCERVRRTGRAFLSTTRLRGQVCSRFCFVNYRTTATDVEEVIELLTAQGADLTRDFQNRSPTPQN